MKKHMLVILLIAFTALSTGYVYQTVAAPVNITTTELPLTRDNLLKLVNEERAKVNAAPLIADDLLNTTAQWKANDMELNNYFGHVKPGETSSNGVQYLLKLDNENGNRCTYVSENLAWITQHANLSANAAMKWWENSKPHHEAMIDPTYTLTGFGITNSIAVEHFCRP